MRAFSAILASTLFVLSAHAAVLDRRAVSNDVALCIADIKSITGQYKVLTPKVDAVTLKNSYKSYSAIINLGNKVGNDLYNAGKDCCNIVSPLDGENSDALLATFGGLVPEANGTLISITSKSEALVVFQEPMFETLTHMSGGSDYLNYCLYSKFRSSGKYLKSAHQYKNTIEIAFADAISAYSD